MCVDKRTIDEITIVCNITDPILDGIADLVRRLRNYGCANDPNLGAFTVDHFLHHAEGNHSITITKGTKEIMKINFNIENDIITGATLSGHYFRIGDVEFPASFLKAFNVSLLGDECNLRYNNNNRPPIPISSAIKNVFGKAIVTRDELENVFGSGEFRRLEELNNLSDIIFFDNKLIIKDKLNTTDLKTLKKILNEIDRPRRIFKKYDNRLREGMSKKEGAFFSDIKKNYEDLRKKEHELKQASVGLNRDFFLRIIILSSIFWLTLFTYFLIPFSGPADEHLRNSLYLSLILGYATIFILEFRGMELNIQVHKEIEASSFFMILWIIMYFIIPAFSGLEGVADASESFMSLHGAVVILLLMDFFIEFTFEDGYALYSRKANMFKIIPLGLNGLPHLPPVLEHYVGTEVNGWIAISFFILLIGLAYWWYKDRVLSEVFEGLELLISDLEESLDPELYAELESFFSDLEQTHSDNEDIDEICHEICLIIQDKLPQSYMDIIQNQNSEAFIASLFLRFKQGLLKEKVAGNSHVYDVSTSDSHYDTISLLLGKKFPTYIFRRWSLRVRRVKKLGKGYFVRIKPDTGEVLYKIVPESS